MITLQHDQLPDSIFGFPVCFESLILDAPRVRLPCILLQGCGSVISNEGLRWRNLLIPGPTDVHSGVLAAQNRPMIGHRSADFDALFAKIQPKFRHVFFAQSRVYLSTSSGTGLQEAAVRNCAARNVLCCVNGAFSQRRYEVAAANGKEVTPRCRLGPGRQA
jgi:hypothetical protein